MYIDLKKHSNLILTNHNEASVSKQKAGVNVHTKTNQFREPRKRRTVRYRLIRTFPSPPRKPGALAQGDTNRQTASRGEHLNYSI